MDIAKAIEYVRQNGSLLEKARLDKILGNDIATEVILDGFRDIQNPDGGFPFMDKRGYPSCLSNTALALHTLIELDFSDSETVEKAISFLYSRQEEDGSWEENHQIMPLNPPFWDVPGDPKTTTWLTADITDILLRAGRASDGQVGIAASFIKKQQDADGGFSGFIHPTWMTVSIFGKGGLDDPEVWKRALNHLESQELEGWDASCISWCLDCLHTGGLGPESDLWARLSTRLEELQSDDGRWPSEDGEHFDVQTTNSIIILFKRIEKY